MIVANKHNDQWQFNWTYLHYYLIIEYIIIQQKANVNAQRQLLCNFSRGIRSNEIRRV